MAEKKIPERMCLGCNEMKPKNTLIRIVKTEDAIVIDPTGKQNGRGAYVCDNIECIRTLVKRKGLDRSFKMHISEEIYQEVLASYEAQNG